MADRSYLDLSKYYDDFRFLVEMKSLLINEISRMKAEIDDPTFWNSQIKGKFFTETEDGREVKIVLPQGFTAVSSMLTEHEKRDRQETTTAASKYITGKALQFVGFMGTRRDPAQIQDVAARDVSRLDDVLVKELTCIDGMFAYVTGERVKGGDHGNLVLFRDKGVVRDLFKSRNHGKATEDVSPHYYTSVRIHSGLLVDGLTSPFFSLNKTLFLCFTVPPDDPDYRRVQMWRACREESDLVKVLPS